MKQQIQVVDLLAWRLLVAQPAAAHGIAHSIIPTLSWVGIPVVFWTLIIAIGWNLSHQSGATDIRAAAVAVAADQPVESENSVELQALSQNLSGADLEFQSWQKGGSVLSLRVNNGLSPADPAGVLKFTGVSFANLPARLEIAGIGPGGAKDLQNALGPDDGYAAATGSLGDLSSGGKLFAISGADGQKFLVVADRVDFTRDP